MSMCGKVHAAACLVMSFVISAASAAPATAPATPDGQQRATVVKVTGLVEVRDDETQPWRKAEAGMVLPVGTECRTGPRSSITLTIPPEQVITLDRLGSVKILEAMRGQNKLRTDLGMRYGRLRYSIEAAGLEHETTIRSPSNALAIRGTETEILDDGLGSQVTFWAGQGELVSGGRKRLLGTGPEDRYGDSPIRVDEQDTTPAEHNLALAANPYHGMASLVTGEKVVISTINTSANSGMGLASGLKAYRPGGLGTGGELPGPSDTTMAPGTLAFNLSWTGDRASGNVTPDLDLFLLTPKGELLIPATTPFTSSSGAKVSRNDRGGTGSTLGVESVVWEGMFPLGKYTYGARYVGTGDPATLKILVLLDGRQINADFDDTLTELDPEVSFTIDIRKSTEKTAAAQPARQKSTGTAAAAKRPAAGANRAASASGKPSPQRPAR